MLVLPVFGRQVNPPCFIFLPFILFCRVPGTPGRQDEHSTEVLHGQAIVQANSAGRDGKDRPRQAEQRTAATVLRLDGEVHLLRRCARRRKELVHAEKAGRCLSVLSGIEDLDPQTTVRGSGEQRHRSDCQAGAGERCRVQRAEASSVVQKRLDHQIRQHGRLRFCSCR